jgi:SH3-like domain-containing protein
VFPAGAAPSKGRVTGLEIPRFVSLAAKRAHMRVGPGTSYKIKWVYMSPGLPLEILAEYGNWRKVRDQDGAIGWMYHALLSGRRTGRIAAWRKGRIAMRSAASPDAPIVARLEAGLVVVLQACSGTWCRVTLRDEALNGYVRQQDIWGAYPYEVFE